MGPTGAPNSGSATAAPTLAGTSTASPLRCRGNAPPTGCATVCDSTVHAHAGPVVSRGYRHRLHLVAEALVAVGRGVSYTRAAQRARVAGGATHS